YANGRGGGGGAPRNHVIPTEPPYTAYIGNAPDSMVQGDFEKHLFTGMKVKQVRLVRDRQTDRFRGFAYVDFEDEESLRRAIDLDGTFINDRPIRIDVAVRPLGGAKNEGFRNKPGFESHDNRRVQSGNNNDNRSNDRFRPGGRRNYNQGENFQHTADGHNQDESYGGRNYHSSNSDKNHERYQQKASNDDVFIALDTPASSEDVTDQTPNDQNTSITRQTSRNWADCPIDETTTEQPSSPPPSADNTFSGDDFQVVRNKNPKTRMNQQTASRPMNNQYGRGRNNVNDRRGGPPQMTGGRNYYEQNPAQYMNQHQQQSYRHQQQGPSQSHMGSSYRTNNNNTNYDNNNRNPPSSESRQRLNSNRSNTSRTQNDNSERTKTGTSESSNDINNNSASSENRPRLQLLPRSQKASSSTDEAPTSEPAGRNSNIFGCGKPRDERDPKVAELNKHIEEVVEKEQHIPRTQSTTSNGSVDVVAKKLLLMASTLISSKANSKKSSTNNTTMSGNSNESPLTEEELKKKEPPITVSDVLRLRKSTNSYLTETDENAYKINFVHFRIRDMNTNKILFEVERDSDDDEFNDEVDSSAGRFVQYNFPSSFLKLEQVGAS
ncbi:unnamed protein product, partial [Rotaria socialis]